MRLRKPKANFVVIFDGGLIAINKIFQPHFLSFYETQQKMRAEVKKIKQSHYRPGQTLRVPGG
jgi:hypothetical protein